MGVTLSVHADEGGTYIVNIATADEDGTSKAAKTLSWTWTDGAGTVIHNRGKVEITSPTASEDVVLSGDDLAIQLGEVDLPSVSRIFTVTGTYDSLTLGNDLPLRGRCYLTLDNYEALPLT